MPPFVRLRRPRLHTKLLVPVSAIALFGVVSTIIQITASRVADETFSAVARRFDAVSHMQAVLDETRSQNADIQKYITSADEDARNRFILAIGRDVFRSSTAPADFVSPSIMSAHAAWRRAVEQDARIMSTRPESEQAFEHLIQLIRAEQRGERERLTEEVAAQAASSARARWLVGLAGLLLLPCGLACLIFVQRAVARPLRAMTDAMLLLSRGERDVEMPAIDRADEIGDMNRALRSFQASLRERDLLATRAREHRRAREERNQLLETAISAFDAEVRRSLSCIGDRSSRMRALARALTSVADDAGQEAVGLAASSGQVTTTIEAVAASVDDLGAAIQAISDNTEMASAFVSETNRLAHDAEKTVSTLDVAGDKIVGALRLIESIAAKTSLLALNATIEAARAGAAGRGFAVVASEVKALANQTRSATEEITAYVSEIRSTTADTVAAIAMITSRMTALHKLAGLIASSVDVQSAATRRIVDNTSGVVAATHDLRLATGCMASLAKHTASSAEHVESAADELTLDTTDIHLAVSSFLSRVA